jgi:hypothetical protein
LEVYKTGDTLQKSGWSFRANHDIIARFISQDIATRKLPPA